MLNIYTDPTDDAKHTRYVLTYPDGPAIVGITGLLEHYNDTNLPGAVAVDPHGNCEAVVVEVVDATTFNVVASQQDVVVEVAYTDQAGAFHSSEAYIDGFTSDQLPVYMAGAQRR